MSKFKEGDYVILREDARYPPNGSLWSTVDDKLVPGELFRVKSVGRYSWYGKPEQDCVTVKDGVGYIPEICFDPVQIQHFEEGEWVECYRLPNTQDWCLTNCGEIGYKFKVGEKYQVSRSSITDNIKILINSKSEGWYPPTVFRRTTLPVQELPENWKVKCKTFDKDTPELLEWRNTNWISSGYITSDKIWDSSDSNTDTYTEISYETFLEKVYKPWKLSQSTSSPILTSLPDKWMYSLQNETPDRLKLIQEWRLSVCRSDYKEWILYNHYSICNHEDGSYFYTGNRSDYIKSYEGALEITKEIFDKFVLQPWIDKGKPTPIIPQQETPKSSDSKIVTTRDIGARVVRGRDWKWGEQDKNGTGTIIEGGYTERWTGVKWDSGHTNCYRIGDDNKYDLYYAEDQTAASIEKRPAIIPNGSTSPGTTVSYQAVLSSTPHLIINKPKKRLLSTEVQELNVNLKLLKTP